MDSKKMIYFFLICTIGFSSVSDGQLCIDRSKCVADSQKSFYRFGGYLDACGKANTTGRCTSPVNRGNSCHQKSLELPPRLVTYGQSSGNTSPKKIICYGFENNMFGCRNGGFCHPRRVVCRSYDDTPVTPPKLDESLKVKNFHEINVGESLTITCNAEHASSFKWENRTMEKATFIEGKTLKIEKASFVHQGSYRCYAIGTKAADISEPQVVVVKGYLQFIVELNITSETPSELITNITNRLVEVSFEVREAPAVKNADERLEVFKFLGNMTAIEAHDLLDNTLKNVSTNIIWTYIIISTGYCTGEKIITTDGELTFPATLVGADANSDEKALTSTTVQRATRRCDGDYKDAARWHEPIITNVKKDAKQNISSTIDNLQKNIEEHPVSSENASHVADVLQNITESNDLQTEDQVDVVVNILQDVAMVRNVSVEVTIRVVTTVSNLVETSESNETEARLSSNSSATLLHTIELQIDNVRDSGQTFNFTTRNIEVYIVQIIDVNVRVIYTTYFEIDFDIRNGPLDSEIVEEGTDDGGEGDEGKGKDDGGNEGANSDNDPTNVDDEGEDPNIATSIEVDSSAIDSFNNITNSTDSDTLPISFLLHRTTTLFNDDHKINTLVVSASVNGDVEDLPDESNIITKFHPIEVHRCAKPSCVYWDPYFNGTAGAWSTDGCFYIDDGDSKYTCRCNHLTNFAVLLDIKGDIGSKVLDYLTIIGCIVSVWCIIVTIFSYLGIKKLRTSRPQQIVLNICFALLGLYLSFLTGIDQAHNHILCIIFGALIHFFTLASVTWMSVEATNMYLLFVKVFNVQISHFMIKASLIGWGIPAVIVLISAITSPDAYSNCKYCFPDSGSIIFYVSVLSVVVLLLTYNLIIFVLVTRKLTCARAKMTNRNSSRQETFRRLQNAVAISVLLGVTWIFGLLAVGAVRWFFNFLFCLANSFQGCCIFLLFCVRQQEVRSAWMTWLRLSVSRVGPTGATATTGTNGVSKEKATSGEKSTSGVNSRSKMELSKVKNVSEVSVAEDPLNVYAEVGETSYDEVKATPSLKTGPTIYHGYTELDARHRVLPPLPEEAQYTKRINSIGNPQAYMEIGETPSLFNKRNGNQTEAGKNNNSTKSTESSQSYQTGYGFVDYTTGTLVQDANVRPTSSFLPSAIFKKSKGGSKENNRRGFSTKN